MKNFSPIRGTNDYAPKEAKIREIVRQKILASYQNNGFNLITTPILENLELLNMSDGGDNLKLMFKTVKRGDKLNLTKENLTEVDIVEEGLRYDLTVPLARFYANNREKLPTPFKSIQIDYSFRAERPQRGRDRQFIQCDVDIFGDSSINAELELLKTVIETYSCLGFNDLTLKINNRQILNQLVVFAGFKQEEVNTVCVTLDKLDKIAVSGVVMELLDKGFNAENINMLVEEINDIVANGLNSVLKYGVEEKVVNDMSYLINNLNTITNNKVDIRFDISIVRGQGYYTGSVYEFYTEGFGGAIGGGGRYDKMVEKMVPHSTYVEPLACSGMIGLLYLYPYYLMVKKQIILILRNRKGTLQRLKQKEIFVYLCMFLFVGIGIPYMYKDIPCILLGTFIASQAISFEELRKTGCTSVEY